MDPVQARLAVLGWLAECQRNRCVAVPAGQELDQAAAHPAARSLAWTRDLGCVDFSLGYEPRSIAVSPDGRRVAVGTKDGRIHLASWKEGRWIEECFELPATRGRRAVRGLTFLGPDLLVAGAGPGVFTITALDADGPREAVPREFFLDPLPDGVDLWFLRFLWMLPLFPGLAPPVADGAALALGLTPGRYLHVLRSSGQGYEVSCGLPEDLLEDPDRKGWEEARVVDGEWGGEPGRERLWLLDSRGRLLRFRPGNADLGIVLDKRSDLGPPVISIPYLRSRPDARSLSVCRAGVTVRFGEDVTFVSFADLRRHRKVREPQWVQVPGMMRCVAFQEFDTRDYAYVAVATQDTGLRWIPWKLTEEAPPQPLARGGLLAMSGSVPSLLELAAARSAGDPNRVFLVMASRDHRLRIASLLDKDRVRLHLEGRAGGGPPALADFIAEHLEPVDDVVLLPLESQSQPAIALRILRSLVERDVRAACHPEGRRGRRGRRFKDEEIGRLLGVLTLSDLQDLLRHLRKICKGLLKDASCESRRPGGLTKVYRRWCLVAFQQAVRLDERVLRDLSRLVLDDLEEIAEALPPADLERSHLGLFAGFLRKWFVFGYTYGEKRFNLLDLAQHNLVCGRELDALFYLTRVLRGRVDLSWERPVPPVEVSSGIWDITAPPGGAFFLHSHTDGRLFATDAGGRPVRWEVAAGSEAGKRLEGAQVGFCDDGLALVHLQAREFRELYRHGPYARMVYVQDLEEENRYLVVFGLRGWLLTDLGPEDHQRPYKRYPRLVALEVVWHPAADKGDGVPRLVIADVASKPVALGLYAIARQEGRGSAGTDIYLMVGTGGVSVSPGPNPDIVGSPQDLFLEVHILRSTAPEEGGELLKPATGGLTLEPRSPQVQFDQRWYDPSGAASMITSGLRRNPAWSLDCLHTGAGLWLWVGMQDGRLRPFLWDERENHWLEGGIRRHDPRSDREVPALATLSTYSPVWKLRCLSQKVKGGPPKQFLAYGTADGIVGIIPLARLRNAEPVVDEKGVVREEETAGEPEPWVHLVHTRQQSAIRGLAEYKDGQDWNLAVLTEKGRVNLFHLARDTSPRKKDDRFIHGGLRLDGFRLPESARALCVVSDLGDCPPILVAGGADGTISRSVLSFPRYSSRRVGSGVQEMESSLRSQTKAAGGDRQGYLCRALGPEAIHPWLRLCAVGTRNLQRFSLWCELRELQQELTGQRDEGGRLQAKPGHELLGGAGIYAGRLKELADEVYGRKPIETEAAKILWSEAAQFANKIAEIALLLPRGEERALALDAFHFLHEQMDHLVNRWIGADQEVETKVLIHSFIDMFDWSSVVLLAANDPGDDLQKIRKLLLFKVVQTRLRSNELIVPLEALRVMNTGILRAIVNRYNAQRQGADRSWRFVHRPYGATNSLGYYDLLRLAGGLAHQLAGRLPPSDPLYTELGKFFALSILLVPDGSLIVGQVVSESGLAENGMDMGRRILGHARIYQEQLEKDFAIDPESQRLSASPIERFQDSLAREIDPTIDTDEPDQPFSGDSQHPWRRLLAFSSFSEAPELTDDHFLQELRQVFQSVARLARLRPSERGPEDHEIFEWLGRESSYAHESQNYLKRLKDKRQELMDKLEARESRSPEELFQLCDQAHKYLESEPTLTEPRRSYYFEIIQSWERELDRRGQKAVGLVRLIDGFNRHVYRTSADDLMASLVELAMRSAPLAFRPHDQDRSPLRLRIREEIKHRPFLSELVQRGTLLVQGSHFAAALLHLANRYLAPGEGQQMPLAAGRTNLREIRKKAREVARLEGVKLVWSAETEEILDLDAPGDEMVWATILRELARNVYEYCRVSESTRPGFCLSWKSTPSSGGGSVVRGLIGGRRAFFDALVESEKTKVLADKNRRAENLLARLAIKEPGGRYGSAQRESSGFGLFFLLRLFEMLEGTWARLLLAQPDHNALTHDAFEAWEKNPAAPQPLAEDFNRLRRLPLTLALTWRTLS